MSEEVDVWYFNRGVRDAEKGRGPLFRNVRGELVPEGEGGDDWEDWKRHEYMRGYDSVW